MSDERTRPAEAYSDKFYAARHASSVHAARTILVPLLESLQVRSAIDFGCGGGAGLVVAKEHGVERVTGVEGPWVDRSLLQVEESEFIEHDLGRPLKLEQRFDLAISLEVAEHLPPERADSFVEELCSAAHHVLFSAAVPGQGGRRHLNERWQSYWAGLFAAQGFSPIDSIRQAIWTDREIDWWYRQNTILYVQADALVETCRRLDRPAVTNLSLLDLVHPDLLAAKQAKLDSPGALAERLFKLLFRRPGN